MLELVSVMDSLAAVRPVFHSEADFQHALAMQIATRHPDAAIRLEYRPIPGRPVYVDVWVSLGGYDYAVELKYKTRGVTAEVDGERFDLANHGAQDIGKHDFWKDVQRLEEVIPHRKGTRGATIFLTNDRTYWTESSRSGTCAEAFYTHDGRTASGSLLWASHTGAGTMKNRESGVSLQGSYRVKWRDYGIETASDGLMFRYALLECGGAAGV